MGGERFEEGLFVGPELGEVGAHPVGHDKAPEGHLAGPQRYGENALDFCGAQQSSEFRRPGLRRDEEGFTAGEDRLPDRFGHGRGVEQSFGVHVGGQEKLGEPFVFGHPDGGGFAFSISRSWWVMMSTNRLL